MASTFFGAAEFKSLPLESESDLICSSRKLLSDAEAKGIADAVSGGRVLGSYYHNGTKLEWRLDPSGGTASFFLQ